MRLVSSRWDLKGDYEAEVNRLERHLSPLHKINRNISRQQVTLLGTAGSPQRIAGVLYMHLDKAGPNKWCRVMADGVCSPPPSVCLPSASAEHDHMCLLSRASSPAGQRPAFAVRQGRWEELHGFLDETLQHPSVKHGALPALRSPSLPYSATPHPWWWWRGGHNSSPSLQVKGDRRESPQPRRREMLIVLLCSFLIAIYFAWRSAHCLWMGISPPSPPRHPRL